MYEKPKAIKGQIKAQFATLINNISPNEEKERLKEAWICNFEQNIGKTSPSSRSYECPVFDLMAYEMFEIRVKLKAQGGTFAIPSRTI